MSFRLYPFGTQTCSFTIASYSQPERDVKYVWKSNNPVTINMKHETPSLYIWDQKTPEIKRDDARTSTGI